MFPWSRGAAGAAGAGGEEKCLEFCPCLAFCDTCFFKELGSGQLACGGRAAGGGPGGPGPEAAC